MANFSPALVKTHISEISSVVSNGVTSALGAIILSLVFLVGVPGNLFIVWSILARTSRHSVTTLLILNLACADSCLLVLTIFFIVYLAKQTWVFGDVMCKVLFYLSNINMYASIFLITLMSAHRLVAVVYHRKMSTLITTKIVRRVIIGMWVLVVLISFPSLVFRFIKVELDQDNTTHLVCAPNHRKRRQFFIQYFLETVSGFILPYAIIITSYVLILRRLRQTKFRRYGNETLILAIVVTFGIFWLPYHVINIMEISAQWMDPDSLRTKALMKIIKSGRAVSLSFSFISSCANPILYTFAGKSFIKDNGLTFMARLFEGTSIELSSNKKSSDGVELTDVDSANELEPRSTTSPNRT